MKRHPILLAPTLEQEAMAMGYRFVCGTDEAGRGPLAGDVVAAAVILPPEHMYPGLNDSKKMTPRARDRLYEEITETAIYAIASATPEEIDKINILNAAMLAMRRAIDALPQKADFALVDGNCTRGFTLPCRAVVGGDGISPSIAAASVLAKVTRDRICLALDAQYPEYHFAKHKGYPTKEHMDLVRALGPCPAHRKSFLGFLEKEKRDDDHRARKMR